MADDTSAVLPPEATNGDYGGDSVQVFRDFAHIRQRPGMYIGDTASRGLHHLVYELVYNSVDEALAGHAKNIHVVIDVDGSLSVSDDGRGIPVEMHPVENKPTLEVVMTTVGAGAKFDKRTYKTSAGLHGIGAKAVTALSEWTEAEVRRNGRVYRQEYERGKPTSGVEDIGASGGKTGTKVSFKPDPEVFHETTFSYATLENRLRELAFLNKGLRIKLTDKRENIEDMFHFEGGVAEFVEYLNKSETAVHKPVVYIDRTLEVTKADNTLDPIRVEVALQWTEGDEERVYCYANNALNPSGGTHLSGFRGAVTRALNAYAEKEGSFKNINPRSEDFREGLTAIVSVGVPEPQFEGQTKVKLNNPEVEGAVQTVLAEHLAKFLEENPKDAQRVLKKIALAAEAREAAAKARKALKDRKSILSGGGLPGKLMDCTTRDRESSELFLVEGQSAGGTADSGRDRNYQAILPLRGKVLNVEKARLEKLLGNEEIRSLMAAVGVAIGNDEDTSECRYGKVILLTDADVDGQHIRTLLLTFFYRQMRKLIDEGRIFVARPPLYRVTQKKHVRFVQTLEEMDTELMSRGQHNTKLTLPAQGSRAAVTFEGERLAKLVTVLGELERSLETLERRGMNLASFLNRNGASGLPVYRVLLGTHEHWFVTQAEVDEFRQREQARLGHDLVVGDDVRTTNGNGHGETFFEQELHEVRGINRGLERLREFGLVAADLVDVPRVAGREPAPRYFLENGDARKSLPHLRDLPAEVRKLGERGLSVTRFKGLGEMGAEELWETTLDPSKRTLVRVHLEDAVKAEDMFRTLMGEKVEPRREFIQKHALEVQDIDYHGA